MACICNVGNFLVRETFENDYYFAYDTIVDSWNIGIIVELGMETRTYSYGLTQLID